MAKQRGKQEQQHRGQRSSRQRSSKGDTTGSGDQYKPSFPVNIFTNSKALYAVGGFLVIGGLLAAILMSSLQSNSPGRSAPDPLRESAVAETETTDSIEASPTPDARVFSGTEEVTFQNENYRALVETNKGSFTILLDYDNAPATVNNFVFLVEKNFFDGLIFHRLIPNFVAQTGDPTNEATDVRDGPGYEIPDEPNENRNTIGTVSMAKVPGTSSFGSQFFINLKDNPALDFDSGNADLYYPFGSVTDGLEIVRSLTQGDIITSITIFREDREVPKSFSAADQVIDAESNNYEATIKTAKGDIKVFLFAELSPNTVNSFVFLAQKGYFDGITFHRVVPDFVVQGGDPTGAGTGGPGYETEDEPNEKRNTVGRLSMAKVGGASSFGSQFFINLVDNRGLDFDNGLVDKFYPFGEVISGMDVVRELTQGDVIESITIEVTSR